VLPIAVKPIHKGQVLVVDDDADLRTTILDLLEAENYLCQQASSLTDARARFDCQPWDLVITDMCLEGSRCDGLDLIDYIIDRDATTPVILITGFASIPRAVDAIRRGAVDFIAKPFDRDILLHQVQKALQERRLRMENKRLQAEVNKAAVIEKLNRELDQRINELYRLYTISEGLNEFMESADMFGRIAELTAEVTDAQKVAVLVLDRTRRFLRIKGAVGLPPSLTQHVRVRMGDGLIGRVAIEGKPLRGPQAVPGEHPLPALSDLADLPGAMAFPLLVGGEVFGVIAFGDKPNGADFGRDDEQIMLALVEKSGIRLENQALYEGIYSNLVDTLTSLVTTLEAKDPYTREHSQRVTDYAVALGRHLRLDEDSLEMIHFAGMLHDIGKIGVRDGILTKCGRLTDDEYQEIKQHPIIGERIIKPLGLVDDERSIILHHHERFDGRGYPDGLRGEEIPLLARIVSVTDAFDAMTTTRSYRQAMPIASALAEMDRCAGTQFDPTIVRIWIEAIERGLIPLNIPDLIHMPLVAAAQ
jgi:response regulator RpfG family c-di-GMP phosphodiesterase